jgi:hypothetical protein
LPIGPTLPRSALTAAGDRSVSWIVPFVIWLEVITVPA